MTRVSGPTVIVAPPLPPVVETTTAVSRFAPLSIAMVWPALKPAAPATGITVAPTLVAAPTVVAPPVPTVAMTAVSRLAPVSIMIVCPAAKSVTPATLILLAPAADAADRMVAGCNRKSVQLLSVSRPSGKRPALLSIAGPAPVGWPRRTHAATTLPGSGSGLITLGGPRVDEAAIVEAVGDQTRGVTQNHTAAGAGERRAPEPLVGRRHPLIARGRNRGVTHGSTDNCVNRVLFDQWSIQRDASAERLDGLVARMGKGRRRREGNPRSLVIEGEVGRMVELQRGGEVEARARIYRGLTAEMRVREGRREVDTAGRNRGPNGSDGHRFMVRRGAHDQLVAHRKRNTARNSATWSVHAANFDIGRARRPRRPRA